MRDFLKYLMTIAFICLLIPSNSFAGFYYINLAGGTYDGDAIKALLNAETCDGDCSDDNLVLTIEDNVDVFVDGDNSASSIDWDLSSYYGVIFQIKGLGSSLTVPDKSEIKVSSEGGIVMDSDNDGSGEVDSDKGLIALGNGNTVFTVEGQTSYRGNGSNSFNVIITDGGTYGGGNPFDVPVITITTPPSLTFCESTAFNLGFTLSGGALAATNDFEAQLSDETGDFSSYTVIGTLNNSNTDDNISCTMPASVTQGMGYKIRIESNDEAVFSDNSVDLTIYDGTANVWIGSEASDDWNTANNWCPSSVPSSAENVYIPANTFGDPNVGSTVVANDVEIETGASIQFTGTNLLEVYGDWMGDPNPGSLGRVMFAGSAVQTITSNDGTFNDLIVSNSTGVIIVDATSIVGGLTFTSGIITASSTITFEDGAVVVGTPDSTKHINGAVSKTGTDDFLFPVGDGEFYSPIEITDLSGSATFTAQYFRSLAPGDTSLKETGLNNVSGFEYWDLDRISGSAEAIVTLYWDGAVRSGINDKDGGDLVVVHFTGTEWESVGGVSATGSDVSGEGSITSNGRVSSFSPFTFGSLGAISNPLPVDLLSFEGTLIEENVLLEWSTAIEKNNDYFIVERSIDGVLFEEVGVVQGAGNSNVELTYSLLDDEPVYDNSIIYYRLTQVDYNGDNETFDIIAIDARNVALTGDIDIYPNPSNGIIRLFSNSIEGEIKYSISNISGGDSFEGTVNEGEVIDVSELSDGVFKITVISEQGTITRRLIVE